MCLGCKKMISPRQVFEVCLLEGRFEEVRKLFLYPDNMWDAVDYMDLVFRIQKTALHRSTGCRIETDFFTADNLDLYDAVILGNIEDSNGFYIFDFEFEIGVILIEVGNPYLDQLTAITSSRIFRLAVEENLSMCTNLECDGYLRDWLSLLPTANNISSGKTTRH